MTRTIRISIAALVPIGILMAVLAGSTPKADAGTNPNIMLLRIPGIQGDVNLDGYVNTMDVQSYSWGVSNQSTGGGGGGGGSGKANFARFIVGKNLDKSSPKLMEAVASGKHFATAKFHVISPGNTNFEYLRYCFNDVVLHSLKTTGEVQDSSIDQVLTFSYAKVVERYIEMDVGGKSTTSYFGGWDLKQNKRITAPTCPAS